MLDYLTYWRNIFECKKAKTSVGGLFYFGAELSKIRCSTMPEIGDAGYVILVVNLHFFCLRKIDSKDLSGNNCFTKSFVCCVVLLYSSWSFLFLLVFDRL